MRAVIVGAGRTGTYVALDLAAAGHEVTVLDQDPAALAALGETEGLLGQKADGCDPEKLEEAGVAHADIIIALTGEDEDNLVVSWLARYVFAAKKVIARINNPKNTWLFNDAWGVDAPVSSAQIIGTLIEEEVRFGDMVTLAKLKEGAVSLVEIIITPAAPAYGKAIGEIGVPAGTKLISVLRDHHLLEPDADLILNENDEVVALTTESSTPELMVRFCASGPGHPG